MIGNCLGYVAGKKVNHPMVDELDTVVQKVKHNKDWRSEYMRYEHELAAREHLAREDGRREGLEDGRKQGLEDGRKQGLEDGRKESILESIRNLMSTMHLSSVEAMNALLIPPEKQKDLLALL